MVKAGVFSSGSSVYANTDLLLWERVACLASLHVTWVDLPLLPPSCVSWHNGISTHKSEDSLSSCELLSGEQVRDPKKEKLGSELLDEITYKGAS